MKWLVATDSFKGSLTSLEAGNAIRQGILRADPKGQVRVIPIADGGEGSARAICHATGAEQIRVRVHDPLMRPIDAFYALLPDHTAVIEMAQASGLTLLSVEERDILHATTYGVGEMIAHALKNGCRRILLGIGGSATNDGGVGMLTALGACFYKADHTPISTGAIGLSEIASIEISDLDPLLSDCEIIGLCDVKNPLCGKMGCSAVFAGQKGAHPDQIEHMDGWLFGYAGKTAELIPHADAQKEGAGAAGGLGFAIQSYLGGRLVSGFDCLAELVGLEEAILNCDVVITGEGQIDASTAMGKLPMGVLQLAKGADKAVIAIGGSLGEGTISGQGIGFDACFSITPRPMPLSVAMQGEKAKEHLSYTAYQIANLLLLGRKL